MDSFITILSGGDRRSLGRSGDVVREVLARPERFGELVDAMACDDPVVRMRAADAAEKATRSAPELLAPHRRRLMGTVAHIDQKEVRWHVAQLLPRLRLGGAGRRAALGILYQYLRDSSSIVRTFAMQAMADLADQDRSLLAEVLPVIEACAEQGTPAMRSRGRLLLARFKP